MQVSFELAVAHVCEGANSAGGHSTASPGQPAGSSEPRAATASDCQPSGELPKQVELSQQGLLMLAFSHMSICAKSIIKTAAHDGIALRNCFAQHDAKRFACLCRCAMRVI